MIISSQRYIDEEIVAEKIAAEDFEVINEQMNNKQTTEGAMNIEFIEKEQIWQEEQTRYWFLVDGEEFCIADTNGETQLLGSDGCPIEDCNDHNRVKAALLPEYEKRIVD